MLSRGRGFEQYSSPVMTALKTAVRCANDDMVVLSKVTQLFSPACSTEGCFLPDRLHGLLKKVYVSLPQSLVSEPLAQHYLLINL